MPSDIALLPKEPDGIFSHDTEIVEIRRHPETPIKRVGRARGFMAKEIQIGVDCRSEVVLRTAHACAVVCFDGVHLAALTPHSDFCRPVVGILAAELLSWGITEFCQGE